MSPSGSDLPNGASRSGFTLMELVVTLVVAVILGAGVVRFYKDSYHTYSQQEQIEERNQNAHFILSRFVEIFQQAGGSLPDTGWTVLSVSGSTVILGVNPRAAEQYNGIDSPLGNFIAVGDGSLFANTPNVMLNTPNILVDFEDKTKPTVKIAIDQAYNTNGFLKGIKDNAAGLDSLRVVTAVDLSIGDRIYGYREDEYALVAGNAVIRLGRNAAAQMVLAENIDSLGFTFLNATGVATTSWKAMRSAKITVRARTAIPDPRIPKPGYHLITLPMNVIMRNKI